MKILTTALKLTHAVLIAALVTVSVSSAIAQKRAIKSTPPDWDTLKTAYNYSKAGLNVTTQDRSDSKSFKLHISFTGARGDKVNGLYIRPKEEGVYPCVLLLHGLNNSKESMTDGLAPSFLSKNISVLALDAPMHGEQKQVDRYVTRPLNYMHTVRTGTLNCLLALDWLTARSDVDTRHIGLFGYSVGGNMGAILGGVDNRVSAFVLCAAGDFTLPIAQYANEKAAKPIYEISPSLYIGHISPRSVYIVNGRTDTMVTQDSARRLSGAAKDHAEIVLVDEGHVFSAMTLQKGIDWLTDKLKP